MWVFQTLASMKNPVEGCDAWPSSTRPGGITGHDLCAGTHEHPVAAVTNDAAARLPSGTGPLKGSTRGAEPKGAICPVSVGPMPAILHIVCHEFAHELPWNLAIICHVFSWLVHGYFRYRSWLVATAKQWSVSERAETSRWSCNIIITRTRTCLK